jgi:hypothetical protein
LFTHFYKNIFEMFKYIFFLFIIIKMSHEEPNNTGYRMLCNYDTLHDTCHSGPPTPPTPVHFLSYECVGTGYGDNNDMMCVPTNKPPNPSQGRYMTAQECAQACGGSMPPLGRTSFKCVGTGYGGNQKVCVKTNEPPNPHTGTFATAQECAQACGGSMPPLGRTSFKCVGTGYGGNKKVCVETNEPPNPHTGTFATTQECLNECNKPTPVKFVSYRCMGIDKNTKKPLCVLVNEPPNPSKGAFSTIEGCQKECETVPPTPVDFVSYECVGTGYGGNKNLCIKTNNPPNPSQGRYSTPDECAQACGEGSKGSYKCVRSGFHNNKKFCVKSTDPPNPSKGRFSTMTECETDCSPVSDVDGVW